MVKLTPEAIAKQMFETLLTSQELKERLVKRAIPIITSAMNFSEVKGAEAMQTSAIEKIMEWKKFTCKDERARFGLSDMQAMMRSTASAIAEDIRRIAPIVVVEGAK